MVIIINPTKLCNLKTVSRGRETSMDVEYVSLKGNGNCPEDYQ